MFDMVFELTSVTDRKSLKSFQSLKTKPWTKYSAEI